MAVTTTKIADFIEAVMEGTHNLSTGSLRIALSNVAPASESSNPTASGNGILANVTQIAYTNYSDSLTVDRVLQGVTSNEAGGTYTLDAADFTITASGGAIPNWRYMYIYNDTAVSPVDALIVVYDMGATQTITDGSSVSISFNASGIITVT